MTPSLDEEVEHLRGIASEYATTNVLLEGRVRRLQAEIRVLKRSIQTAHDAGEKLTLAYDRLEKRAISLEEALERARP